METTTAPVPLRPGRYHNPDHPDDPYAYLDVFWVALPGSPDYDGGLPGVGVVRGRERCFVPARDAEHFWSKFPFHFFRPREVQHD